MNELIKLGENTYVITNPVNVGIYVLDNENVCLIDTGSSKDYGKLIKGILKEKNWNLKCIINTHSHADHISANKYLQNEYNCEIYSSSIESYFINEPILEPSFLYGASPLNELCNHFLINLQFLLHLKDLHIDLIFLFFLHASMVLKNIKD